MSKMIRVLLSGLVSLAALGAEGRVQAQTTSPDPVFFAGVVGEPQAMLSTQGTNYTFEAGARPTYASILASPFGTSLEYGIGGSLDANANYDVMSISQITVTTEPTFLSATVDLSDGTNVVGTQDIYAIVFSTVELRDAFLYYIQQREAATTQIDYDYYSTLASYSLYMGLDQQSTALYVYYTGLASYYRDTTSNPNHANYYYYYYIGLGAYYYFDGIGDSESASLAFSYYYQLAVNSL